MESQKAYAAVAERYSALASDPAQSSDAYSRSVAQSFGYTKEELVDIPTESNLGLCCGNPLAIASLRQGETVIDLGSGAGFDVFLAARKVGLAGRAIGVDMNRDMLSLADKNKAKSGAGNVEFIESRITSIPLDGGVADAIISNCVINLVPEDEKQLVFNEMFRLLKPGGRVAVSDILAKKPLPEELQKCAAAYVGCVAGASLVGQYQSYLRQAGFADVLVKEADSDLNVYIDTLPDGSKRIKDAEASDQQMPACCITLMTQDSVCCSPEKKAGGCCASKSDDDGWCKTSDKTGDNLGLSNLAAELGDINLNDWVGSYKIFAVKP
ncbi:ubiE/COQ5 methyltransferase [Pleurostoma richardsiae]|uniref:Arsenite methyltransferase n=1 Tax=Pleurostoma richardsiae TaxID=41990 RepID=A0AA38R4Z6_9PEZI|nr:ubiE/COQ5 methyltransferase [Pleurostoma richardsiae]